MMIILGDTANPAPLINDPELEAMMEAGVHLGHSRSRRNPGMTPYLWGMRNNVEIIDLTKTKEHLDVALAFLKRLAGERKMILFVGTRPSSRDLLRKTADALGSPWVAERWIGGALTNFRVVRKRVETLEGLEHEKATGGFEKYPKKEQIQKEKEIAKLTKNFDGLRRLTRLPDAVVIVDIVHDDLALREARRIKVPVVALTDTNTDPRLVQYPIPANDDARTAVLFMLERMAAAIRDGMRAAEQAPAAEQQTPAPAVSQASMPAADRGTAAA